MLTHAGVLHLTHSVIYYTAIISVHLHLWVSEKEVCMFTTHLFAFVNPVSTVILSVTEPLLGNALVLGAGKLVPEA